MVLVTRVHLVRHGRAAAGWDTDPDPGLDDVGRSQASATAIDLSALESVEHDVVSSPLRRCRETAGFLLERWGRPHTRVFTERSVCKRVRLARRPHRADDRGVTPRGPQVSQSTPIRTARPLVTWSRISDCGQSATSAVTSTPRLIGPGARMSRSFLARFSRSRVIA